VPTIVEGPYEWDSVKARANERKHGVSFAEAATAIAPRESKVLADGEHPERSIAIGFSLAGRLLTVVFEPRGRRERIISARKATREERKRYMRPEHEDG
jgi:uncharacterized protein